MDGRLVFELQSGSGVATFDVTVDDVAVLRDGRDVCASLEVRAREVEWAMRREILSILACFALLAVAGSAAGVCRAIRNLDTAFGHQLFDQACRVEQRIGLRGPKIFLIFTHRHIEGQCAGRVRNRKIGAVQDQQLDNRVVTVLCGAVQCRVARHGIGARYLLTACAVGRALGELAAVGDEAPARRRDHLRVDVGAGVDQQLQRRQDTCLGPVAAACDALTEFDAGCGHQRRDAFLTRQVDQRAVLEQLAGRKLAFLDTMNHWITGSRAALLDVMKMIDGIVMNDEEARLLTDETNLLTAARRSPDPRLFIGRGKLDEVKRLVLAEAAELFSGFSPA